MAAVGGVVDGVVTVILLLCGRARAAALPVVGKNVGAPNVLPVGGRTDDPHYSMRYSLDR